MDLIAIMYHDVVDGDGWTASGFPQPDAARYKLDRGLFAQHLDAIARVAGRPAATVDDLVERGDRQRPPFFLTFDDGGVSAHTLIAGMLEERGWKGHFFVTTDRIGTPGFLDAAQIRDLHDRGHRIGSHSCSHPLIMSACSWVELVDEWSRSAKVLAEILAGPVTLASVPGGYYSDRVAQAAGEAGIRTLFTSEPVARARRVGSCLVIGRYGAFRGMPARRAAALVSGAVAPRLGQYLSWNAKKLIKRVGGRRYVEIRRAIFERVKQRTHV